jgi:penicillin-binding protein-related factor A (putative recombinase)
MAYFYQGNPILAPLTFMSNRRSFQIETLSLKQSTFLTEAQRWELSFSVLMNGNEGDAFLAHTESFFASKTMVMPQLNGPKSEMSFTGTLAVASLAAGGSSSVSVSSVGSGNLSAGYFIKFANHDKIYAVKQRTGFDSSTATLEVFPSLTKSVPATTQVQIGDEAVLKYKLDTTGGQGITFNDGIISNLGTIKVIESL